MNTFFLVLYEFSLLWWPNILGCSELFFWKIRICYSVNLNFVPKKSPFLSQSTLRDREAELGPAGTLFWLCPYLSALVPVGTGSSVEEGADGNILPLLFLLLLLRDRSWTGCTIRKATSYYRKSPLDHLQKKQKTGRGALLK